jgi:hypothetical protein
MSNHVKHFPGQKENEHIKLLIRKHWITDVKAALVLLLIGGIPFLLGMAVLGGLWENSSNQIFWGSMLLFITYILFISLITYVHWLNDELDIIVVTDQRVISHEQIDLFHRQISETNVSQIEDVKGIEQGILESILHFGTLEIMTASNDIFFIMKYVDHPYENARRILDSRDQSIANRHAH